MSLGPLMVDLHADCISAQERVLLSSPQVGGVILFSRNFTHTEQLISLVDELHGLRHPRLVVAVDQEGGRVQRLRNGFTQLPAVTSLGEIYVRDPKRANQLAATTGWLMAAELRSVGIDFSFAPVLDLGFGVSQVIADRAFHKDPEIVSSLAAHYIQGMKEAGMQAVAKHYPGHGAVVEDSHIALPRDDRTFQDLIMQDLIPFQRMINQSIAGLMSAHVVYEKTDTEIATFSKFWLQKVLREQMGFSGAIFSDDLSMKAACCDDKQEDDCVRRTQKALRAGCDMVLICNDNESACLVAEKIEHYNNPASQIRLAHMHGAKNPMPYEALRNSEKWKWAVSEVESYQSASHGELAL